MAIRQKLCDLDKYLLKVGGNITKTNLHVKLLLNQLAARKEHTTDLIANLFKAYSTSSDPAFREYIKKKRDNYEDGDTYTANQIMKLAGNKYESMTEAQEWNAPTKEQEQIMVLKAQIGDLKRAVKTTKPSNHITPDNRDDTPPQNDKRTSRKYERPDDLSEVRVNRMNAKIYYCCKENGGKCNGIWRVHKPSECKGITSKRDQPAKTTKDEYAGLKAQRYPPKKKHARFERALVKNIEIQSDSEGDGEDSS